MKQVVKLPEKVKQRNYEITKEDFIYKGLEFNFTMEQLEFLAEWIIINEIRE
jgi:hypothetical protein